jgi:hypothetical protein
MEVKGSLPCLQQSAIGLHTEPDEFSPHLSHPISKTHLNIVLYTYVLQVVFSVQALWPKLCTHFATFPCVLHAAPIFLSLFIIIIFGKK